MTNTHFATATMNVGTRSWNFCQIVGHAHKMALSCVIGMGMPHTECTPVSHVLEAHKLFIDSVMSMILGVRLHPKGRRWDLFMFKDGSIARWLVDEAEDDPEGVQPWPRSVTNIGLEPVVDDPFGEHMDYTIAANLFHAMHQGQKFSNDDDPIYWQQVDLETMRANSARDMGLQTMGYNAAKDRLLAEKLDAVAYMDRKKEEIKSRWAGTWDGTGHSDAG